MLLMCNFMKRAGDSLHSNAAWREHYQAMAREQLDSGQGHGIKVPGSRSLILPSFHFMNKSVIQPHVIGQEEDCPTCQPCAVASVIQDPRVCVPVVKMSVFDREHLSIHSIAMAGCAGIP